MNDREALTHQSAHDEDDSLSYDDCLNRGGHFWPTDAPEDHSVPCTRCGFDPGWVGRGEDGHDG